MNIIETDLSFARINRMASPRGFVLHHTGETDVDMSAAEIHELHKGFGWSGCGYHMVLRKDGTIERGRPEWAQGAHCPGANHNRFGIHVCGCFSGQLPNDAQLASLRELITYLCDKYSLDITDNMTLTGHRDWLATECPGQMFSDYLPELRV